MAEAGEKSSPQKRRMLLALILLLIIVSVLGVLFADRLHPTSPGRIILFHTISWGPGGTSSAANLVINDNETWSSTWEKAFCAPSSCPRLPLVDFSSRTVLASFSGPEPSSGYLVNYTRLSQIGSSIEAQVDLVIPGACPAVQVYGEAAYHIVDIPKTTGPVVFNVEIVKRSAVPNGCLCIRLPDLTLTPFAPC